MAYAKDFRKRRNSLTSIPIIAFLCCVLVLLAATGHAACTPTELRTLLLADATSLGFPALIATTEGGSGAVSRDADIVTIANERRAGAPYQVNRGTISGAEILANIDKDEFLALTALKHAQLQSVVILGLGKVDVTQQNTRSLLGEIFPAGSATRTALAAYVTRQGSWAEKNCGMQLRNRHVSCALRNADCE